MITPKEARLSLTRISGVKVFSYCRKLDNYITQQEAQSKRLEKVEELLGLYRRRPLYINSVQFDEIDKQIKQKEKELEELK